MVSKGSGPSLPIFWGLWFPSQGGTKRVGPGEHVGCLDGIGISFAGFFQRIFPLFSPWALGLAGHRAGITNFPVNFHWGPLGYVNPWSAF